MFKSQNILREVKSDIKYLHELLVIVGEIHLEERRQMFWIYLISNKYSSQINSFWILHF